MPSCVWRATGGLGGLGEVHVGGFLDEAVQEAGGEGVVHEGRLPPRLDGIGDKLRPAWLGDVLVRAASVRPYLDTRMPQFGAANVGHLAELFVALDRQAQPVRPAPESPEVQREAGRKLVGTDGLSCIACHRFNRQPAHALQVIGLAWRDGVLYATQQAEVTRLRDTDGDGRADRHETVSDAWAWGGEHEFTFGSGFDRDGALWTVHGLTDSYTSERLFRGWALRHFPDGRWEAMCSGLRSPGGIAFNPAGDAFYAESQGPWNSSCSLKHLRPGGFMGHPAGNQWYDRAPGMGPRPADPVSNDENRRHRYAALTPQYVLPAVILPYKKMGQSASAVMLDASGGKFGPFAGQFFIADYTLSLVMRAELEQVDGVYQGACYPFRQGFATGLIGGALTERGQLFVGGSKRGWPVRGLSEKALQRLDWTGQAPCELHSLRVKPDGFELRFTSPVDAATVRDVGNYALETFTHHYHGAYGGPEIEQADQRLVSATPSADGLRVRLVVDKLVIGHIHELHLPGLRDRAGQRLLHDMAYYTLNRIPKP